MARARANASSFPPRGTVRIQVMGVRLVGKCQMRSEGQHYPRGTVAQGLTVLHWPPCDGALNRENTVAFRGDAAAYWPFVPARCETLSALPGARLPGTRSPDNSCVASKSPPRWSGLLRSLPCRPLS